MKLPAKEALRKIRTRYVGYLNWQDIIAGLSIAGLLLPQALAYSSIGNLPAQAGIIGLFAGLLCYGLLGSSRFALVSPTSSSAVVLAATTMTMAEDNAGLRLILASGLVIMTGIIFLLAAATRMGNVTDFIAKPVLRGFTFGLAIVIIIKQSTSVLNISVQKDNLFLFILDVLRQFRSWNYACLAATVLALVFLALMEWLRRIRNGQFRNIPSGTLVIIAGIVAGKVFDLPSYGIPDVGSIELNLNNPILPDLSYPEWMQLFEIGIALVFILYAESYGSIRSFAMKHHDTIYPNRDLFALGISNLVSGIFQGMPVGAGYSATAANGAKTRLAGLYAMAITLVIILTVLPFIEWIPVPVLAAIVISTMATTLSLSSFRLYFNWKIDRLLIVASVLSVLLLGVLQGLMIAIAISLLMMLRQNSKSTVSVLGRLGQSHDFVSLSVFPEAQPVAGILILRPDQSMFFANADRILLQARYIVSADSQPVHTVILSLEQTTDLDATSVEALRDFFVEMRKENKKLILARLKNPVHRILQSTLGRQFPEVSLSRLSVERAVRLAHIKANPQKSVYSLFK